MKGIVTLGPVEVKQSMMMIVVEGGILQWWIQRSIGESLFHHKKSLMLTDFPQKLLYLAHEASSVHSWIRHFSTRRISC